MRMSHIFSTTLHLTGFVAITVCCVLFCFVLLGVYMLFTAVNLLASRFSYFNYHLGTLHVHTCQNSIPHLHPQSLHNLPLTTVIVLSHSASPFAIAFSSADVYAPTSNMFQDFSTRFRASWTLKFISCYLHFNLHLCLLL